MGSTGNTVGMEIMAGIDRSEVQGSTFRGKDKEGIKGLEIIFSSDLVE